MRQFVILIISTFLLVGIAFPAKSDETIIYAPLTGLRLNLEQLVEQNIRGFQSFNRNAIEGLEMSIFDENMTGFKIDENQVNDRDFDLNLTYWPEMPPEYGFYYGHVVECDGLMGRCLIIEDKLKIYLPTTDFMSTSQYWEWRGCQYRSSSLIRGDIIMGYEIPPGVTIDVYCPEHEGYQHAYLLYSKEHGVMRISMYTNADNTEEMEAKRDLFLVNQKGFLAQD